MLKCKKKKKKKEKKRKKENLMTSHFSTLCHANDWTHDLCSRGGGSGELGGHGLHTFQTGAILPKFLTLLVSKIGPSVRRSVKCITCIVKNGASNRNIKTTFLKKSSNFWGAHPPQAQTPPCTSSRLRYHAAYDVNNSPPPRKLFRRPYCDPYIFYQV